MARKRSNKNAVSNVDNNTKIPKYLSTMLNSSFTQFYALNESLSVNAQKFINSAITEFDSNILPNLSIIKQQLKRFPELDYLIDLFSTSILYNSSIGSGINVYVIFDDSENNDTDIDSTITNAQKIKIKVEELKEKLYSDIKFEILELFRDNEIIDNIYNASKQIIQFGFCYAYLNNSYDAVKFFSPEDISIELKKLEDAQRNKKMKKSVDEIKKIDIHSVGNDLDDFTFIFNKTRDILDKNRLFILSSGPGTFGKSLIGKIIHYLKILDLLETSLLIERLSTAKNLNVWTLNTAQIQDDEDIQALLTVYRGSILSKNNIEQDSGMDALKSSVLRTLVDNNVILPVEGNDFLKIQQIKNEYKPILDDIEYYQEKIYFALGIPLYYRNTDLKNVSNIAMAMHEESFASKIRHYQKIFDKFLSNQVELYLTNKYKVKIKYIDIHLDEYIPASKRRDTDADKAKKWVDVFTQMASLLGINIKTDFIISQIFPDKDPTDILEPQEQPQEQSPSEEQQIQQESEETSDNSDISSLFKMFETKESLYNKNKSKKRYYEIKVKFKY